MPQLKVLALSCEAAILLQFFLKSIEIWSTLWHSRWEVFLFCHKVPQDLSKTLNAGHHGNAGCQSFMQKLGQLRTWLWLNDSDTALRLTTMSGILALNVFQWSYMDILSGGELWCCQRGAEQRGRWMTRLPWGILGGLLAVYGGFVGWLGLLLSRLALQSLAVTGVYEVMYSSVFSYHALWVQETWIFSLSLQTHPKPEFCETGVFFTPLEPGEFWFVWDYMVFEVTHGRSFERMCEALIPKLTCWDFQPMGSCTRLFFLKGNCSWIYFQSQLLLCKICLPFWSSVTSHFQLTNCESLSTAKGLRKSKEQRYSNTIKGFFLFTCMVCFFSLAKLLLPKFQLPCLLSCKWNKMVFNAQKVPFGTATEIRLFMVWYFEFQNSQAGALVLLLPETLPISMGLGVAHLPIPCVALAWQVLAIRLMWLCLQ